MLIFPPDQLMTRKALHKVEVLEEDRANAGKRWEPIQHGHLADTVISVAKELGLTPVEEQYGVAEKGSALYAVVKFDNAGIGLPAKLAKRVQPCLGFRHSNNQNMALTFASGAQVTICSNGMVSGEYVLSKMHTNRLDLEAVIRQGLEMYIEKSKRELIEMYNNLTAIEIDDALFDRVLMELGRQDVIPWTWFPEAIREWQAPTFEDFAERNAWSLYNGMTYIAQKGVPWRQLVVESKTQDVITEITGYEIVHKVQAEEVEGVDESEVEVIEEPEQASPKSKKAPAAVKAQVEEKPKGKSQVGYSGKLPPEEEEERPHHAPPAHHAPTAPAKANHAPANHAPAAPHHAPTAPTKASAPAKTAAPKAPAAKAPPAKAQAKAPAASPKPPAAATKGGGGEVRKVPKPPSAPPVPHKKAA